MNRARTLGTFLALAVFLIGGGAAARPEKGSVLRVAVNGPGRVVTSDGRLDCSTRCAVRYQLGKIRRLTATPDAHYQFTRWYGDCIGTAPICDVALDRDTSVRASFAGEPADLQISVGGPGHVMSIPAGLNCGEGSYACRLQVAHATEVTLTPVPDTGGRFGAWDGPCAAAGSGPCTVRVESPVTQTAAAFGHGSPQAGDQPLTVILYNPYATVTSQPAGINCPPTCGASFPSGTVVTLLRNSGLWAGACTGEELDRCLLVLDAPTEVGVTPPPPPPPRPPVRPRGYVDVTVSGAGLVTSTYVPIQCGFSPRPRFHCHEIVFLGGAGSKLPLRANPRPGARFIRWGGSCRGRRAACELPIVSSGRSPKTFALTGLFRITR